MKNHATKWRDLVNILLIVPILFVLYGYCKYANIKPDELANYASIVVSIGLVCWLITYVDFNDAKIGVIALLLINSILGILVFKSSAIPLA
jgi:hypothetical protein